MKLDKIDGWILKELLQNGRAKYMDIGKKLGVGSSTVRWRIKRLEDEGVIIGYTSVLDIEYFKLNMVIFFIRTSKDLKNVITQLNRLDRLTSIAITFGDSNIVCRGVFEEISDLLVLKEEISKIEGVGEIQTCITYKGKGPGGNVPLKLIQKTDRLDTKERQIIVELIKNGRIEYTELAKKLNINTSTARSKVMQLVKKRIIRKFTAKIDLTKLGQFPAFLRIRTEGGGTGKIIQRLVEFQEISLALPCIGECDIFSRAIVSGAEDLNRVINDKIINIEGINDVKADCTVKGERIGGFLPPRILETFVEG